MMNEAFDSIQPKLKKGSLCSLNGKKYECDVYNVVKNCIINDNMFNIQSENELGGVSSKNDLICKYETHSIGVEIKKYKAPDWMQCSIKYNTELKQWEGSKIGKIPEKARELFNRLINNIELFNGEIPPFMTRQVTHEEWLEIKKNSNQWNDKYISVPNDTISKLYNEKGCQYIQISNGYGLYHTGIDICNFNVPKFEIEQQIRVRTKIHSRKNKKGFCDLSVTIACQPKNIKLLEPSPYSLDNKTKLPSNMHYIIQ
jgi:hypothetical protein